MPTHTKLWANSFAERRNDAHAAARERLRANYEACHDLSAILAAEIVRDNPSYTVHDVTHMDALWELADLIAGTEYPLTPAEAFVVGCAMLVHDLAMGMAAFPGRETALLGNERWRDTVYVHLKDELGRRPTQEEIQGAPGHIHEAAKRELLRDLHAEQAERLTHEEFRDRESDSAYFLISDPDLRNIYGDIIGRIAASHGWSHGRLAAEFDATLGAPASLPREWTVDPLKLACLLRVADASHLDSRRAPGFLRAVRSLDSESRLYWIFQERLNRPWVDGDRLVFTASQPFSAEDSEAWWLCIDTLRMVDRELRVVDVLLADTGRPRFVTRSVAYIDDIERLARYIPVRDWFPIDAKIKVGDVIDLVHKLGGQKLYGDDPSAALRELISNASDAVRARRALGSPQELAELRLRVSVQIRLDEDREWLIVRDNGIGMTRDVMSGPLLDFGKSYWSSSSAREDFPGLISSGFSPTGEFGIGFFSVFMLGDQIRVTSRRFDLAASDTHVLIFNHGLGSRPLLRRAVTQEFLPYGGTEVAVALNEEITGRLLKDQNSSLKDLCSWLCPATDVNLDVISEDGLVNSAVEANDWVTCTPATLIGRLRDTPREFDKSTLDRLRCIGRPNEQVKGRAAIPIEKRRGRDRNVLGVITVGGMRSSTYMNRITGVFIGQTLNAARDAAIPLADIGEIADWASEQAALISSMDAAPEDQIEFSRVVCTLGGDPGDLIIAQARYGFMTSAQIRDWALDKDSVLIWNGAAFYLSELSADALNQNVLAADSGWPGIFQQNYPRGVRFPGMLVPEHRKLERGPSLGERCAGLVFQGWGLPEKEGLRQYRERVRVVQDFEKKYMERDEEIPDGRDPRYPFREEVATTPTGVPLIDPVTPLVRQVEDREKIEPS